MSIPRGAAFHEQIANDWGAAYARTGFRKRLELFQGVLDRTVIRGQLWLDLGCGSGVLSSELLKRGARVVAFDGSPSMLAAARRSLSSMLGADVQFEEGDAQDLSRFAPCTFDGVLCSSVIEYVEVPDALIRHVSRVLKDDGALVISMPPTFALVRMAQKTLRAIMLPFGVDRYSYLDVSRYEIEPDTVEDWLGRADLRVDRIAQFDSMLPVLLMGIFRPCLLVCEARKTVRL
ncbi:MAG: methyltransferase domain-containing protein [Hyphomicrobiaceae bacterium]